MMLITARMQRVHEDMCSGAYDVSTTAVECHVPSVGSCKGIRKLVNLERNFIAEL